LEEAIGMFPPPQEVFIIGGAEIYRQAMPLAGRFYLTEVYRDYEGDVHFPAWNKKEWKLLSEERHEHGEEFPYPFAFKNYVRKAASRQD
jgi:dihydrofolate reductase